MKKFLVFVYIIAVIAAIVGAVCAALLPENKGDVTEKTIPTHIGGHTADEEVELTQTEEVSQDENTQNPQYRDDIAFYMDNVNGECQWGYTIFSTDETYHTESKAVPSASVIKVFIMEYAFEQIEDGKLSLTDKLASGTVSGLIEAMITRSDNSATNVLIDYFGMDEMNLFFAKQGYGDTRVQRKMLDTKAQSEGRDNYTSVQDVMLFLNKLYKEKEQEPYASMLKIMKRQQVKTKIPLLFPGDVIIANKTGELSNVENDIGIIFGDKGDYAVAFLCSGLADTHTARNAISNAAYTLYVSAEKTE